MGDDILGLKNLEAACHALRTAVSAPPRSELERDGVIQRFEFTFELCWKTLRKALVRAGRVNIEGSPRPVLRAAREDGMIENLEMWFSFLQARNLVSHTYNAALAAEIYEVAVTFKPFAEATLHALQRIDDR